MKKSIKHFSDTVWFNKRKPWITTQRMAIWYNQIGKNLWIQHDTIQFISSWFWKSYETGIAALQYLVHKKKDKNPEVLLVNNASRAKYKDSWNAKGSNCLIAQITIHGIDHFLVWVDDDVFSIFESYDCWEKSCLKAIKILSSIDYEHYWLKIHIPDLSKWTQFRSKNYFIAAQLILIKELEKHGNIDLNKGIQGCRLESFAKKIFEAPDKSKLIRIVLKTPYFSDNIRKYDNKDDVKKFLKKQCISYIIDEAIQFYEPNNDKIKDKLYLPGYKWIENVLNYWEFSLLEKQFDISTKKISNDYKESLCAKTHIQKYSQLRKWLEDNQIALIHIDLFWNAFFTPSMNINAWINDLWNTLNIKLWEKIELIWEKQSFTVIFTNSISDHTGDKCIWNSSWVWVDWEILLNVNRSIDASWKIMKKLQKLKIWEVLEIKKI